MTKTNIKLRSKQIIYGVIAMILTFAYLPNVVSAAAITTRSVKIGSSLASAYTTYNFTFTAAQATTVKSVGFAACTTASGTCTPAPGFDSSTSTLAGSSNLGSGGSWTVSIATPTELRMLNASNTGAPSVGITANFTNVKNPSAPNSTFFMRITTYSDSAWTTAIDTGTVATSTAGQITVTASVDETLTFTLATATVAMGTLTSSSTGKGTSAMTVGTNGAAGYTVGYKGTTLTSAGGTIAAMAAATGSSIGTPQFGMNLMANATPSVGLAESGPGTGTVKASSGYDVANSYKFNVAGEDVATAAGATDVNTYTTSYIANINAMTPAGAYSTVITYTATANF
jgi:hypothetical protein